MRTHRFPQPLGVSVVIRPRWTLSFGPRCGESRWGGFPDYPGWLAARRRPAHSFGPRLGLVMGVTVAYALAGFCRPQRAADVCATSVASRAAKLRVSKRMCGAVRTSDCTDAYAGQKLSPRTICVASVNGSARLRLGQMYGRPRIARPIAKSSTAAPAAIFSSGSPRVRFDPDTEIHVNRSDVDLIMEPLAFANSSPRSSRGQQLIQLGVGGRKRNQNEDNC